MAKVQKTIFGNQIKSFEFLRTYNHRLGKHVISGIVWLDNTKRIRVEDGMFYLINSEGVEEGILLKSNPGYRRVKRMIARWFQTYRKGGKSFFRERVSTLREVCQQAQYNLRIKMIQKGSISFNHYYSAS